MQHEGPDDKLDAAYARLRIASAADNELLTEMMADVPMEGSLVLSTRRDPDFFALYDIQRGAYRCHLYDDAFQGMATVLDRDGFLDGVAQRVGYLGDLRIRGTSRERVRFPALYGRGLADHSASSGCRAYYTAVLAENALAIASLTQKTGDDKRARRRRAQPLYTLITPYQMASIQVVVPPALLRARAPAGVQVRTAVVEDVPRIARFLHEDHQARAFGYRFDTGELEHRLAHWPGFSLDNTFLVEGGDGALLACATAWDPSPVKRYRVLRWAGAMRALRASMRGASAVLGCPPLPRTGEDFRTLYLTNLSVKGDDPLVLRALLGAVYPHAWRARAHLMALPLWGDHDPHAEALRGFLVQRLAFSLYGVTLPDSPRAAPWPRGRPGFEIALA